MPHRILLTLTLLLAGASTVTAGEDYYLLMFGAQRVPSNPNYAHSFATFVRVCWVGDGPCPTDPVLEAHTISWLPANMTVRTCALFPKCGANFDLHTTLRWCQDNCMRVSLWGAYRVCPDLYHQALHQKAILESGQIRYKAIDTGYSTDRVCNCISALSNVVEGPRLRIASPGWGETASYILLQRYSPHVVDHCPHTWVGSALGLDQYPIIYRDWQHPHSGAILGPLFRIFGSERNLQATYGPPCRS